MSVFNRYSQYYDLLYRDKNYAEEADFVQRVLSRYGRDSGSVLDLGCGTGRHAMALADIGFRVLGVDRSPGMVDEANRRRSDRSGSGSTENLAFSIGDVTNWRCEQVFDAVVSLFHVVSYQLTNSDLLACFATARRHLNPGGLFLFDCWYGPAVLSQKPEVRIKRIGDDAIDVLRVAEPQLLPNENRVDVSYEVIVSEKGSESVDRFNEVHSMRYIFAPEVELMLQQSDFELIGSAEWLTDRPLDESSWNCYFVARAIGSVGST